MSLRVPCMNCTTMLFSESLIIYPMFFLVILLKNIIDNLILHLYHLLSDKKERI